MCDIPLYGHTRLQFDLFSAGVYIRGVGAVKTEQKGFEEAMRGRGQDPLRLSPLAGFQLITTKNLATWSTRLASINPGLFFINLIFPLLKTFAKAVMMERIREEGWDIGTGVTVFR